MADMAPLPAFSGTSATAEKSVAGSVKSALGVSNTSVGDELESSEATFTDYLLGLAQPQTAATAADAEGGKALPLAGQFAGLAAGSSQPATQTGTAELPELVDGEAVPAAIMPALANGDNRQAMQGTAAQTASALRGETLSQSIAMSGSLPAGMKSDSASSRQPGSPGTTGTEKLSVAATDLAVDGMPQLRSSAANAMPLIEPGAGRQLPDAMLATGATPTSTVISDSASASLLRTPLPQTGVSTDNSFQVSTPTLSETFGRPEWNQGLGRQIMWMVNQNIQTAEIRLNPAHLGPIEVRVEMDDEQVNVAFSSRHAAVREAVEMAMPRLREMFESSGMNLADANVSHQSFAEQRENQMHEEGGQHARMFASQSMEEGSIQMDVDTGRSSGSDAMIDYYI